MAKILFADDDRLVLLTISDGLRHAGFEVIEARDGSQALALCLSESPDLALIDIHMPGLNGLELAERLRDETKVPFIFLSAFDEEVYIQRAAEIGALGFLKKPIQLAKIITMIHDALAKSQGRGLA